MTMSSMLESFSRSVELRDGQREGRRSWRSRIIAAGLLCALVLGGCSALRLTYSQGPQLSYLWLDRQFDFDDRQSARAKEGLRRWFEWHRHQELPPIAALLTRAADEVMHDTTGEQLCRWWERLEPHADAAVEHALPDAADLARLLGPEQLATYRKRQARGNEKYADDYLQPDPVKRRRAAIERSVERAERLYGRLGAAQRKVIEQAVDDSPFDARRFQNERLRRQGELLRQLERLQAQPATGRDEAIAGLRQYWHHVRHSPDEAYASYARQLTTYTCAASARVHNATTPAQRASARERLREWATDLRGLAAAPTSH